MKKFIVIGLAALTLGVTSSYAPDSGSTIIAGWTWDEATAAAQGRVPATCL